jgi:ferredoxin
VCARHRVRGRNASRGGWAILVTMKKNFNGTTPQKKVLKEFVHKLGVWTANFCMSFARGKKKRGKLGLCIYAQCTGETGQKSAVDERKMIGCVKCERECPRVAKVTTETREVGTKA